MTDPRLPHQIDTESLLDALENDLEVIETEQGIPEYFNDIIPFLSRFEINPGPNAVNTKIIYDLYKAYSNNPVNKMQFALEVNKYLPHYSNHNGMFYRINLDAMNMSKLLFDYLKQSKSRRMKSTAQKNAFEYFLNETKLQGGKVWCEGFLIYEAYVQLRKLRHKKSLFSYPSFINMLKLYFPKARRGSNRSLWFQINPEFISKMFTKEERQQIRESRSKNEKEN